MKYKKHKYKSVHNPTHPVANKNGLVCEHRAVLYDKIGPGSHPCHWCGKSVTWLVGNGVKSGSLVVDHLDDNDLNNDPTNLVPSCHGCNVIRGLPPDRMLKEGELFLPWGTDRVRAEFTQCEWCKKKFLIRLGTDQRFCSPSCAGSGAFVGKVRPARRALTADGVRLVRKLLVSKKHSKQNIANQLSVHIATIKGIAAGTTYRWVD